MTDKTKVDNAQTPQHSGGGFGLVLQSLSGQMEIVRPSVPQLKLGPQQDDDPSTAADLQQQKKRSCGCNSSEPDKSRA